MVDQNVRNVTELTRLHSSPENDEILLIGEALPVIDQWPDKRIKITPVKLLPDPNRKCSINWPMSSSGASSKSVCQPSLQQEFPSLSEAIEAIPRLAFTVPSKRPSVECADSQKKRPPPAQIKLVTLPTNQTSANRPTYTMKDGSPLKNGRILHCSPLFLQTSNPAISIESSTGPLRRRTIHSVMPSVVVTSTTDNIPNAIVTPVKGKQTQELPLETTAIQSKCGQCGKLCDVCECAAKVVTCGIVSSTCEPFQTLENFKRKNLLAKQNNSKTILTKQSFYGNKLTDQFEFLVSPPSSGTSQKFFMSAPVPVMKPVITKKPRLAKMPEPECLTISSDDEEEKSPLSDSLEIPELPQSTNPALLMATRCERMRDKDGNIIIQKKSKKSPTVVVLQKNETKVEKQEIENEQYELPDDFKLVINCRSIRVGSYKLHAYDDTSLPAVFTKRDISFTIPTVLNEAEMVSLTLRHQDIASVLAHLGKALVVLFIYTTPGCGGSIRSRLLMKDRTSNYYDPCAKDETCKRITILPTGINKEERELYRKVFPKKMIQEITQIQANEILVRSVPVGMSPEVRLIGQKITRSQTAAKVLLSPVQSEPKPIVKLLTYPPPPQTGGITVTSEDLECLNALEFLNDVIIDFYLKYLVMEKLNESQRPRMHVFSSFFYPRLTQKPTARNSMEENTSITSQQKRHGRVKTWTRHIDIFEKDFIIVPVNQNAHWFLAIICFPGKVAEKKEESKDNKLPEETSEDRTHPNEAVENSNTQEEQMDIEPKNIEPDDPESPYPPKRISLVPSYDSEDSSEDVANNMTEEPTTGTSDQNSPCILILDSLPGPSRWRIVATLREYLEVEWETKKGSKCSFDRETMRGRNVRVPVQTNFSDCGVYLLQYVESFFENPSKLFTCSNLELWFDEESVSSKRDEIRQLILTLQKKSSGTNSNNTSSDDSSSSSSSSASDLNNSNSNAKEESS